MPDATAKSCDVDLVWVGRIGNDTVAALKVEPRNARPMFAAIGRSPSRGFETRCVKNLRIARVHGYVIDMAVAGQKFLPSFFPVFGKKNPTPLSLVTLRRSPRCLIKGVFVFLIEGPSH